MTGWEPEEFSVTHPSLIFIGALSLTPPSIINIASYSGQCLSSVNRQGLSRWSVCFMIWLLHQCLRSGTVEELQSQYSRWQMCSITTDSRTGFPKHGLKLCNKWKSVKNEFVTLPLNFVYVERNKVFHHCSCKKM